MHFLMFVFIFVAFLPILLDSLDRAKPKKIGLDFVLIVLFMNGIMIMGYHVIEDYKEPQSTPITKEYTDLFS